MRLFVFGLVLAVPHLAMAQSDAAFVESLLDGRSGQCTADRRQDNRTLGVKTGCSGNTFKAEISIRSANASTDGQNIVTDVVYRGKYTRQGWIDPCVRSGRENVDVNGVYRLRIEPRRLNEPEIVFVGPREFGNINDENHDSNKFAFCAVRKAVKSAF